jgi:hypothetical protein
MEVEQPAKPPAAHPVGHWRARDESIVETLMIPLAMIVLDELCEVRAGSASHLLE